MAAKIKWHRSGTKLRQCHPMYTHLQMRRKYHEICRSAAGNDIYKEHRNHPNSKKFYKVIVNIININTNMQANAYLSEDGKKVFWILRTNVHRESKKARHQTLGHNFTNYPDFQIFSLADSVVNLQQIYVQILHHALNMSLHYFVKYECRKMALFWNTYCN